ncbi:LON peptidase substrate-binding domain-containing protein [Ramlibacter sp. USB13]|uniref:LON peptidase substrate-binding domain-containing protein n=1 Tax=Ramlibacter cellulosilyticus TaxID=2764187 RepID=A0A923S9T3_9BURK|nr:LON peptidase substrate-binding domain-containing protein [Ramlibacter cellulosilyticus]MBC5782005.1 LON peptidase substrate-binding domain-containing protein [Ramlibacter cellulosilyticus]
MIAAATGTDVPAALTLQSLPLFPLSAVLFPDGLLSLRVFEVRYLDMITKCRKAGAPFGVVSLTQGNEVRQPGVQEAFAQVGTLATIDDFEQPQPGLMLVRAVGAQRFRIRSSDQLKHGLWVADVESLQADMAVTVPEDLRPASEALQRLIQSLQLKPGNPGPMPLQPPWKLDDCGWVANRWCELLPLPVALKQRLMELDNPLVRLELVSDVLTRTGIMN